MYIISAGTMASSRTTGVMAMRPRPSTALWPQFLPFEFAHLVKGEDFHPLDRIERGDEVGHPFDVFRRIGQAGDEYEADPHRFAQGAQATGEIQRWLNLDAGDAAVRDRVEGFDVEQDQINVGQQRIRRPVAGKAGGVDHRMQLHGLAAAQQGGDEFGLEQGFATGNGDAAARAAEKIGALADVGQQLVR